MLLLPVILALTPCPLARSQQKAPLPPKTPKVGKPYPTPFEGSKPPPKQATPDVPIGDRIAAERFRNEQAYRRHWLPRQKTMREKHAGKWIGIVAGRLLPCSADGEPRPTATLQELDREAAKSHPRARHRFLFRIGDEGDEDVSVGMCELERIVGGRVIHTLSTKWTVQAGGGFFVQRAGKWIDIGAKGPDKRSFVAIEIGPPSAPEPRARTEPRLFCYSNIFGGTLMLPESDVDARQLARWEIPGELAISGLARRQRLRRVLLRCRWPKLGHEAVYPAALVPARREHEARRK